MNYQKGGPKVQKTKIYHSTIAQSPNGVKLRIASDTKDSKYPDSAGYVFVEMENGEEAMLVLENADVRAVIDNTPQRKWVTLKGEGKGPGAWMIVEDESGPVMAKPQDYVPMPEAKPPQKLIERPPAPAGTGWMQTAAEATDIAALIYGRLEAAGHPLDSAGKASVFSTVFIAMDRRN